MASGNTTATRMPTRSPPPPGSAAASPPRVPRPEASATAKVVAALKHDEQQRREVVDDGLGDIAGVAGAAGVIEGQHRGMFVSSLHRVGERLPGGAGDVCRRLLSGILRRRGPGDETLDKTLTPKADMLSGGPE